MKRLGANNQIRGNIMVAGIGGTDNDSGAQGCIPSILYLDKWILIALVITPSSFCIFQNLGLQVMTTIPGSFSDADSGGSVYEESGDYYSYIGSSSSFTGLIWYFVIDNDEFSQYYLYTSSATSTCLSPSCKYDDGSTYSSSADSFVDPYQGTGFISLVREWNYNFDNTPCPDLAYGCSASTSLICECTINSCVLSGINNVCYCEDGFVGSKKACSCTTGFYLVNGICCETSCATCDMESLLCLTCIADNAYPDSSQGCNCNNGYFGTKPLTTINACTACFIECATCSVIDLCESCKSLNADIDDLQGCKCSLGYWGTAPLITSDACAICYIECASCNADLLCTTCKSLNAYADATQGCKCNTGYWGTAPLTLSNSCMQCYSECSNCIEDLFCTSCISSKCFS